MLKKFDELYAIDVRPYCDMKKGKDDNGRVIEIPYLSWGACELLLRTKGGAERVSFKPHFNSDGGMLFASKDVKNKDGRTTGCYFVAVDIEIDDLKFTQYHPLLNGNLVVYDDTLNQQRIDAAQKRAFVKGVAVETGLGLSLWAEDFDDDKTAAEDLSFHNVWKVKQRIEETLTAKLKSGKTMADICTALGIKEKNVQDILNNYFNNIAWFEGELKKL